MSDNSLSVAETEAISKRNMVLTSVPKAVLSDRVKIQTDCPRKAHVKMSNRNFALDFGTGSTI